MRVRRALWYGLNVKALIREVSHDVNVPGYTDQPAFLWAYNPNVPHYDYDVMKATQLLAAAGWQLGPDGVRVKDGKRLSLTFANVAGSANGNAAFVIAQRENVREISASRRRSRITRRRSFFSAYQAGGIVQTGKFDLAFYSWLNGTDPDDSVSFMCNQFPPAGQGTRTTSAIPSSTEPNGSLLVSYDQAVRKKAYDEIQFRLADQVPMIVDLVQPPSNHHQHRSQELPPGARRHRVLESLGMGDLVPENAG